MTDSLPVSVVIPAFNRADLVGRAIDSAFGQRPRGPAEVIVVDDASADDTGDVAERHGATVVRLAENRGEGGARNAGMAVARHDWVAFLDSDDEWLPAHLAQLWPRRGDHVVVCDSAVALGGQRETLIGHPSRRPVTLRAAGDLCFPANPVPLSAVLAQRSALLALGGFRSWRGGADLDMWLRAIARGSVLVCPEIGYRYHSHPGQVTQDVQMMRRSLLEMMSSHRGEEWCSADLLESVTASIAYDELRGALRRRDPASARRHLRWLLQRFRRLRAATKVLRWRSALRRRARSLETTGASART